MAESSPDSQVKSLVEENTRLLQDLADLETQLRQTRKQFQETQKELFASRERHDTLERKMNTEKHIRESLGEMVNRSLMIAQFCREITTLDLTDIVDATIQKLPLIIGAQFIAFYRYDHGKNCLVLWKHNFKEALQPEIPLDDKRFQPIQSVMNQGQSLLIPDETGFQAWSDLLAAEKSPRIRDSQSAIVTPLVVGIHKVGFIALFEKTHDECFDEKNDLPPVEQLSAIIGTAVRNFQLYSEVQDKAKTDGLTGLLNHSAFYEALVRETERAFEAKKPLGLLVVDLDNFKEVNDQAGHLMGDQVLKDSAGIIRSHIRPSDVAARYGGDEFAVLLPDLDQAGAQEVAKKILKAMRTFSFESGAKKVRVSASIGAAQYDPAMHFEDFFKMADQALYNAKSSGKNVVRTHLSPPE